jgi:hypothetical protein
MACCCLWVQVQEDPKNNKSQSLSERITNATVVDRAAVGDIGCTGKDSLAAGHIDVEAHIETEVEDKVIAVVDADAVDADVTRVYETCKACNPTPRIVAESIVVAKLFSSCHHCHGEVENQI